MLGKDENLKYWLVGVMWREKGGEWRPGAAVSVSDSLWSGAEVGLSYLNFLRSKHPDWEVAATVYVDDLVTHLSGRIPR